MRRHLCSPFGNMDISRQKVQRVHITSSCSTILQVQFKIILLLLIYLVVWVFIYINSSQYCKTVCTIWKGNKLNGKKIHSIQNFCFHRVHRAHQKKKSQWITTNNALEVHELRCTSFIQMTLHWEANTAVLRSDQNNDARQSGKNYNDKLRVFPSKNQPTKQTIS